MKPNFKLKLRRKMQMDYNQNHNQNDFKIMKVNRDGTLVPAFEDSENPNTILQTNEIGTEYKWVKIHK